MQLVLSIDVRQTVDAVSSTHRKAQGTFTGNVIYLLSAGAAIPVDTADGR